MDKIGERIKAYVGELLEEYGHEEEVTYDTPLVSSGLLDSFAVIRLVVFMEKDFGISFAGAFFDNNRFDSIGAMIEMVNELAPPDSS